MTYCLSYRDFTEYIRRWDGSPHTTMAESAGGEVRARLYVWKRFARCHGKPVPPPALLPEARTCKPAVFNDPDHWDAVYRRLVRQRASDARAADYIEGLLPGETDDGTVDPWGRIAGRDPEVEDEALADLEVERLRAAIREEFNTSVPYGPELQEAMLEAAYNLESGFGGDFFASVKDALVQRLPTTFSSDEKGRQRLSRANKRAREFVHSVFGDR